MLELLYSSDRRWESLRAEGREWRSNGLLHEAWTRGLERRQRSGPPGSFAVLSNAGRVAEATLEESSELWRLWIAPPFTRAQFQVGPEMVDVVFEGNRWWSRRGKQFRSNEGETTHGHGQGWGMDLIHPRRYIPCLEFKEIWEESVAGRQALIVRAETVMSDDFASFHSLHGLVIGDPDEVVLAVDVERGVILRSDARLNGQSYRIVEMTDVRFDVAFEPGDFDRPTPHR